MRFLVWGLLGSRGLDLRSAASGFKLRSCSQTKTPAMGALVVAGDEP